MTGDIRACVFDAYGTLFDFASATRGCRDLLGGDLDGLTALWRDKQLQYTWLRAIQGKHVDFWQVTGDALDFALNPYAASSFGMTVVWCNRYRSRRSACPADPTAN